VVVLESVRRAGGVFAEPPGLRRSLLAARFHLRDGFVFKYDNAPRRGCAGGAGP
jgi:hypothetical protein